MVMPAALSISVSASTKAIPSRAASRRPTDDLQTRPIEFETAMPSFLS